MLIVQWSAGVRMKGCNTIALATRLIQILSFMVFFASIIMLQDGKSSSSVTFSSHTSINFSGELTFQVPFSGVDTHVTQSELQPKLTRCCLLLGRISNRCILLCRSFSIRDFRSCPERENTSARRRAEPTSRFMSTLRKKTCEPRGSLK